MVGVFAGRFDLEVGIFIPKGHTKKLVAKKWRPQCSPPGPFGPFCCGSMPANYVTLAGIIAEGPNRSVGDGAKVCPIPLLLLIHSIQSGDN